MLLTLKFWGLGVQTLKTASFYSHKKQVLGLARAGEIILFDYPHPQSHCAPLKKPEASSLRPPAWIWVDPFSGRGVRMGPINVGVGGFSVPLVVVQPRTLCWATEVAPTAAQSVTHPAADDCA